MAVQPLGDRILVKLLDQEEKTSGGIILPDTAKEKPQEGKVLAVGKGRLLEDGTVRPLEIKKGDTVLFAKYSGTEILLQQEPHLILKEEDILAVKAAKK
ncbi:MAG: co-chaperone GroES [Candidatus Omnitrophica bacterium CG11_big_fil_rev_8_21_14_0_20_64_10]|nr:MAG: co-chaperone GroES [Candidatus Omnitrophica bacterium CG11_big_fil_rev_8_21_14_0_20_64_10]